MTEHETDTACANSERIAAAREALLDAADHLFPGGKVGPDWLIYLAVTKYGRGEYDPETAESLIQRHRIPPGKTTPATEESA